MPGRPDWVGTPLAHGANRIVTITQAVPASGQITPNVQFAKPGYMINLRPQYSGASGANPFCRVNWRWVDANPATLDLGEQDWTVPVLPNSVYQPVLGRGLVGGPFAELDVTNLDTVQPISFIIDIWETTQHIARDDWRDSNPLGFQPAAGFTAAPGAQPSANVLASFTATRNAAINYILPLYAGQAWLDATIIPIAGATGTLQVQPYDQSALLYNSGSVTGSTIFAAQPVTMPRKPCLLSLFASGGNVTFEITLTAMEYAS